MLKPNSTAPLDVNVIDQTGAPTNLRSQLGKWVVLYFYPKDNTPGCTVEACSFRDASSTLNALGAVVIGVSKDSAASHQKFATAHNLNFPLWSDPDHQLLEAFGAWGEKKFMGRLFMGIIRSTFVINPQGVVVGAFPKVTPKDHGSEIVTFLKSQIETRN